MFLAVSQTRYAPSDLQLIVFLLLFATVIDLITTFSSNDPEVRHGRRAWWLMSPLPWTLAAVYRKLKGAAAPIWMPWAAAFVIYAVLLIAGHFWR